MKTIPSIGLSTILAACGSLPVHSPFISTGNHVLTSDMASSSTLSVQQEKVKKDEACTSVLTPNGYECLTTQEVMRRGYDNLIPVRADNFGDDRFLRSVLGLQYECSLSEGICSSDYLNAAMNCVLGYDTPGFASRTAKGQVQRFMISYRGDVDSLGSRCAGEDKILSLDESKAYLETVLKDNSRCQGIDILGGLGQK